MPVNPSAAFYQLLDDGNINEKTRTIQEQNFLDDFLSEQQLIFSPHSVFKETPFFASNSCHTTNIAW
jgi:hypothetical protein